MEKLTYISYDLVAGDFMSSTALASRSIFGPEYPVENHGLKGFVRDRASGNSCFRISGISLPCTIDQKNHVQKI
jgi:hypothetical protein